MLVGEGKPSDVIDWFLSTSAANWLGFFLAGDEHYNKFMSKVIGAGDVLNSISGYDIDLFVFDTDQAISLELEGGGRALKINGAALTPLRESLTATFNYDALRIRNISDINRSIVHTKRIIRSTSRATNDLAELIGLSVDDLPSLTLIRKDFDYSSKEPKIVLRTRGQADVDFIVDFIRAVRRAMKRQEEAAAIVDHAKTVEKLVNSRKSIERQAGYLCKLLTASGVDISFEQMTRLTVDTALQRDALNDFIRREGLDTAPLMQNQTAIERVVQNTRKVISKSEHAARHVQLRADSYERDLKEIEDVVAKFERRISFKIAASHTLKFFELSTSVLTKMKKLIALAAAVKSGGASLLK